MSNYDTDLFVIGAGSGGVRAARIAASHGARVAIAEEYRYGGTCVIRGCIPKKLYVYASEFSSEFSLAADYGWTVEGSSFSWSTLRDNKEREISRLSGLYEGNLDRHKVKTYVGRARLQDAHTVTVAGETITSERILIAVGGRPFLPEIPGIENAITSDQAFDLDELPADITIVGGGYIAIEFAGIFKGLGSKVTLIHRGERLLRGFDGDVQAAVAEDLHGRGVELELSTRVQSIEKGEEGSLLLNLADGRQRSTHALMFATGRVPNTAELGLGELGVELGKKGEIIVSESSQSSVPNIYAVGDCTDRVNLTPVAIREGHAFADSVYGNAPAIVNYDHIPTAVFSQPPVATVGLTESAAREREGDVLVYKSAFRPLRKTLGQSAEKVLLKLIVSASSHRVLGVHMVGKDAPEIIQMAAIAIKMGATKSDFDATIALHPSTAEEFVLMRTPV